MVLQERVAEAQRMASMELKEVCTCFFVWHLIVRLEVWQEEIWRR